jgi:hypothetical protein
MYFPSGVLPACIRESEVTLFPASASHGFSSYPGSPEADPGPSEERESTVMYVQGAVPSPIKS